MCTCMLQTVHVYLGCCGDQRLAFGIVFPPFTMGIPGMELELLSDLVACALPHELT